jgi:hypothetical protein
MDKQNQHKKINPGLHISSMPGYYLKIDWVISPVEQLKRLENHPTAHIGQPNDASLISTPSIVKVNLVFQHDALQGMGLIVPERQESNLEMQAKMGQHRELTACQIGAVEVYRGNRLLKQVGQRRTGAHH